MTPITSFYIFCNLDYGRPFIDAAIQKVARTQSCTLTVVFSSSKTRRLLQRLRLARRVRGVFPERNRRISHRIVRDVNACGFVETIHEQSVGIIAGFNQIFDHALIQRFDELVNFHPSILPLYRGAIPSYWVVKNNERRSGITMHEVIVKVDSGRILFQEYVDVTAADTEATLDRKISLVGARVLEEYIGARIAGKEFATKTLLLPYQHATRYAPSTRDVP